MRTRKPAPSLCHCGKAIVQPPGQGPRRQNCSDRCWRIAASIRVKPIGGTCLNCGEKFANRLDRGGPPRKHCTDRCRREYDNKMQRERGRVRR